MKKFLLSSFVIVTFIGYAIHDRLEGTNYGIISPNIPVPTNQTISARISANNNQINKYKNGDFTGVSADAYYGNVQVKVSIQKDKIIDIQFLDYPHDRRTSEMINSQAMPLLKSETIQAQSAEVDVISGATQTSKAYIESLQSALSKAKV